MCNLVLVKWQGISDWPYRLLKSGSCFANSTDNTSRLKSSTSISAEWYYCCWFGYDAWPWVFNWLILSPIFTPNSESKSTFSIVPWRCDNTATSSSWQKLGRPFNVPLWTRSSLPQTGSRNGQEIVGIAVSLMAAFPMFSFHQGRFCWTPSRCGAQ